MKWFERRIRSHPTRLATHDYCGEGLYHIVLVTKHRHRGLGQVLRGTYQRSVFGYMVEEQWRLLQGVYPFVRAGTCVAMPDHVHGLLHMKSEEGTVHLNEVIASLKARTTRRARELGYMLYPSLWQPGYWDVIIRSDEELHRHNRYIQDNPRVWLDAHRASSCDRW